MSLDNIGFWLKEIHSEDELVSALMDILERDKDRIAKIQRALSMELEGEDGDRLSQQVRWLDANMYFVATLKADADALLDKAEEFYRIPPGRSVPCTTEDGSLVPATGCRVKPTHEEFVPKYKEVTDLDRNSQMASKCAAFRRLRNEYANMETAIQGRLYRAKDLLEELKARHRAAGVVERRM